MNLKTRYFLWKFRKNAAPSAAFKNTLRADLSKAWGGVYGSVPWYASLRIRPVVGLVAIVLLFVGSGTYAYGSSQITEGTMLYPVKQIIEHIEEVTKVTPEAKAQFLLKQIERRQAEKQVLQKKHVIKKPEKDGQSDRANVLDSQVIIVKSAEKRGLVYSEQERIEKTERAIDKVVRKLEESDKVLEKNGAKNNKLRTEIKNQVEQRKEAIKNRLEYRFENQENRKEDFEPEEENQDDQHVREILRDKRDF